MSMVENGQVVSIHYVGTLADGNEFDNSRSRGEAFSFRVGEGQVIPGFDQAMTGMEVGEVKSVTIEAADGYGEHSAEAIQVVPRTAFPEDFDLKEGLQVQGNGPAVVVNAIVESYNKESVTLDMNHPLAGKTLNFEIELISIS